jgi:hypothetical protein
VCSSHLIYAEIYLSCHRNIETDHLSRPA